MTVHVDICRVFYLISFVQLACSQVTDLTTEVSSSPFQCVDETGNAIASPNCTRFENTKCEFECNDGYTKSEHIPNLTLTCTQNGWDVVDALCQELQCVNETGNAKASPNCTRFENTKCEFECNDGYTKSDHKTNLILTCTQSGWDAKEALCQAFQCVNEIGNAKASQKCTRFENTKCEFECNDGYIKSDHITNLTLTCTQNGWDAKEALCQAFQCVNETGNALAPPNCTRFENTKCEFECNDGYTKSEHITNLTLTCTQNGWDAQDALCQVFECANETGNARASPNCTRYENTICEFECIDGFTKTENVTDLALTCTKNGWDTKESICKVFQCANEIDNATASDNCSRYENSTCEFKCNDGYTKSENITDLTLTCTEDGWDTAESLCQVFQCNRELGNATASNNCSRHENTSCEFQCMEGYVVSNTTLKRTMTCTMEGWSGPEYLCKAIDTDVTESQPTTGDVSKNVVFGVVIAVAAFVLILALVMLISILQLRKMRRKIASFSNVSIRYTTSSVGIDNPAYIKSDINGTILEDPLAEESESEVNRRYSLTGIEGVDLDDSAILTMESWQKEKSFRTELES